MKLNKFSLSAIGMTFLALSGAAVAGENRKREPEMKIEISLPGTTITGTLEDTPTARDFASLLPLKLQLKDYNGTEKIADLPKKLTSESAPAAITPKTGDIAFYAPWGNIAIFYRDFERSPGLIRLGRIDQGLDALTGSDSLEATIKIIADNGE